jgi:hypothetical protein
MVVYWERRLSRRIVSGVLVLVLIGMFSFSRQVSIECTSETNKVSRDSLSAYGNVTTHEGDLVINGTQMFVIENCTFIQTGNIRVRDRAKLVIRNSELCLNGTYPMQYNPVVEDYGILEVENSLLVSYQALNIDFKEHSNANFNNATINLSFGSFVGFHEFSKATIHQSSFSVWHGLLFDSYSEASITRSKVVQIQVANTGTCDIDVSDSTVYCIALTFGPSYMVKIDHIRPGFYQYLSLQEVVTTNGAPCKITLNNTLVETWAVHVYYDSETLISDSIIDERLGICIQGLSVRIDDLRPQFFEYKKIGQITLNRTSIARGIFVVICDSAVTITNSSVTLDAQFNSDAYVSDSIVDGLATWDFSGSLFFERTVLKGIDVFLSDFFMYGNVSFGDTWVRWFSSNVTRNYNMIAKDMSGNPVENAELTLLVQNDTVVWNGLTDSLGKAGFNLTFTDTNYTDTLRLEAVNGNYSALANVTFLSDTPIILKMRYFADLNSDGTINIVDISIVARAFGSRTGDPNWNPIADLDKNGQVNILDIALVARDYGKTV